MPLHLGDTCISGRRTFSVSIIPRGVCIPRAEARGAPHQRGGGDSRDSRPKPEPQRRTSPPLKAWQEEIRENPENSSKTYRTKKRSNFKQLTKASPGDIPIARVGTGSTSDFFSASSWKDLGATGNIIDALKAVGITRPSHIQAASFGALKDDMVAAKHVLLADHAGSGKTLSYLVPLIQRLKEDEATYSEPLGRPCQPRIVVVVPTNELASQVLRVCRALSKTLKFRCVEYMLVVDP